ncbi:MAG: hypothetical protein U9R03_02260 [Candidatus Aerophobetes bacterium]|nr:hypothetical protein [Candidatus Aerophobetes bacterium]
MKKLKTVLIALALVMLTASLGMASQSNLDFEGGNGSLNVYFVGQDVDSVSINSTTGSDLIREDSFQAQGEFVFLWQEGNPSTVDRFAVVTNGSAEFDQSYPGAFSYGASVEPDEGMGTLWSYGVSDDTSASFFTGLLADLDYTISLYASNDDSSTSVEVTQSNEDAFVFSEMLVSWNSDSPFSDPLELQFSIEDEFGGGSIYAARGYRFCAGILSLWSTPAIPIEMMGYLAEQAFLMFDMLRNEI